MFPSQATSALVLRARPDRRADDRFIQRQAVEIDGMAGIGCDISAGGIAVITIKRLSIGDIVRITYTDPVDAPGPTTSSARVARITRKAERFLVGLQFVQ